MTRLTPLLILALALWPLPHAAEAQTLSELRTQLQATLQRTLGRSMIDGALHHVDLETGDLRTYYPTENHEIILRMGDVYVMCATLVDAEGREVPVDYYLVESGGRFGVVRMEIDNRTPLQALMDVGRARRLQ
jgi:hypothetical protein